MWITGQTKYCIQIYTGHPHYDHIGPKLVNILKKSSSTTTGTNVVIFGHGNVALDCARILAKGGTKEFVPPSRSDDNAVTSSTAHNSSIGGLYDTDIATRAWNVLRGVILYIYVIIVGRCADMSKRCSQLRKYAN